MVVKAELSHEDKEKIHALLRQDNALDFMSSEESEEESGESNGPPPRHIKPLKWERTKLKRIKVVLDSTYQARMSKRQKRTAAKITRNTDRNFSTREIPHNCPPCAGRIATE